MAEQVECQKKTTEIPDLDSQVKSCEELLTKLKKGTEVFKKQTESVENLVVNLHKLVSARSNTVTKVCEIISKCILNSEVFDKNSCYAKMSIPDVVELRESKLNEVYSYLPHFKNHLKTVIVNHFGQHEDPLTNKCEIVHMQKSLKDLQKQSLQLHNLRTKVTKLESKLKSYLKVLENDIEAHFGENEKTKIHQSDLYIIISTMTLKTEEIEQVLKNLTDANVKTNDAIYNVEKLLNLYKNKLCILLSSIENYEVLILHKYSEVSDHEELEGNFSQKLYVIYNDLYEIQSLEKIILQNVEEQEVIHQQTAELHHLRDQVNISLLNIQDGQQNTTEMGRSLSSMLEEVNNLSEENEFCQYDTGFHIEELTDRNDSELEELETTVNKQLQDVDKCIEYLKSSNQ